jgi:hypothetical protein
MTTFVDNSTVIQAVWLNGVDQAVVKGIGDGLSPPSTPTAVKVNLGLDQVNNTSDLNKPISTATQTALNTKQNTLPTQSGNNGKYLQTDGSNVSWTVVDSANITFTQAGVGAVTLSAQNKMRESVSVKDFGAIGDGITDDTAAMQLAHNTGMPVYYPEGTYKFTTITMVSGGIIGNGQQTNLKSTNTGSSNLITYTGNYASLTNVPIFHDFYLEAPISKTTGAGICIAPSTGETSYGDFRNVSFLYCPIGIDFIAASLWKIIGCNFLAYAVAGVQVANTNAPDSGDSTIQGCVFNNPYSTGSGIWQKSSGGLKIIGNKFLGGYRGYTMNLEGSTGALLIAGNSFENMVAQDISLAQGTATKVFVNVAITGNEFSVGGVAISTDATSFLSEVVITGNNINMGASGSNACISLNTVTDFFIGGNIIKGNGGAGSSAVNVTSCTNGKIGLNTYANLPTPIVVSSSPTVTYELDSQSSSSTTLTTGWGGYGTLFISAAVNVTFPRAFLMTPEITDLTITPGSSNGSLGGFVTAISKTGFTYQAISSVTGIAATIYWKCKGVI